MFSGAHPEHSKFAHLLAHPKCAHHGRLLPRASARNAPHPACGSPRDALRPSRASPRSASPRRVSPKCFSPGMPFTEHVPHPECVSLSALFAQTRFTQIRFTQMYFTHHALQPGCGSPTMCFTGHSLQPARASPGQGWPFFLKLAGPGARLRSLTVFDLLLF